MSLLGDLKDWLTLSEKEQASVLAKLPPRWREGLYTDFGLFVHPHQLPPQLASNGKHWTTWLILGGRGAGKTRAGAEWVRNIALNEPRARIALIGETEHEAQGNDRGSPACFLCIRFGSDQNGIRHGGG